MHSLGFSVSQFLVHTLLLPSRACMGFGEATQTSSLMGEIPMSHLRIVRGDFLGSPVIRTLCFHLAPQPVKVKMLVAHLCPSLHNPIDCSPPGSSVHGIPQTRILEWVAIPFSRALVQSLVG